jgi:hypothetical protein
VPVGPVDARGLFRLLQYSGRHGSLECCLSSHPWTSFGGLSIFRPLVVAPCYGNFSVSG